MLATVPQPRRGKVARILVLYYSSYGHVETMAGAIAEGAREVSHHGRNQTRGGDRAPGGGAEVWLQA
jgi:hypothetical protein